MGVSRACAYLATGLLAMNVAGCWTEGGPPVAWLSGPEFTAPTPTVQEPGDVKYFPSDEPLKVGLEHFDRGNYGIAERYFRDAVERAPRDVTAWVALAAACDRIGRFDQADRAYSAAIRLTGEPTQILNNQGYSYTWRGDLPIASQKFLRPHDREPNSPLIANNLQLLDSSQKFIRRVPDPRGVSPD